MKLSNWLYKQLCRMEVFAFEVDAFLAAQGGNYERAAECIMRKTRAQRELDLLEVNHG